MKTAVKLHSPLLLKHRFVRFKTLKKALEKHSVDVYRQRNMSFLLP